MIRKGVLLVVVGVGLIGAQARADNGVVENDDSRFTFHHTDDGFLRLDGRSGQVSICARRSPGWLCRMVPDERVALENEIARLQADNSALKRELLAHDLALPAGVRPDRLAKADEPRLSLPSDAELARVMTFIEKVWKRLVDMIVSTQRELSKKS